MTYPVSRATTALVVVDVQEEYFDPEGPAFVDEAHTLVDPINTLIDAFVEVAAPVIYVRHAYAADGSDVGRMGDFDDDEVEDSFIEGTPRVAFHERLRVVQNAPVVTKSRYDAFIGTNLLDLLTELGVEEIVLVGLMTSFCIDSTARGAHGRDLATMVVGDAIGGPDLERLDGSIYPASQVRDDVLAALANGFAEVVSVADVVERLG
jgi:nicotinamidase-related amidase